MEPTEESANSLNYSQKLHLLTSTQYADKLLSDIESILAASTSKSPFPKYQPDVSTAQSKVVQDYLARIRAQMVRVLKGQGIEAPEPQFGSIHSIRIMLGFAAIAFDECRAKVMRGYGEVPEAAIPELNGLVDEMKGLIGKLDAYLAQGLGRDMQARLEKLQQTGADIGLVRNLERIIGSHGLVEFRPALENIVSRLECTSFEIAFFGRVSSGKSSLLNRIVQKDVLPVGVTPVTAVPTRIVYGPAEGVVAWFADRAAERLAIEKLPDLATEQFNPANWKHVTRIVVELPSARLRDGVTFVDTPGLGSLATAGAAETLAYLPRCDLGVVLIDAGATLTGDDLATIRTLYEAGIPAMVLLSKSDLLAPDDQERVRVYAAKHIGVELGLDLPVHLVSAKPSHLELLESWFTDQIVPLYDRHVELARESLNRKIGALRAGVETALRSRSGHSEDGARDGQLRKLETELRKVAGRFDEIRSDGLKITDDIRMSGDLALAAAAGAWSRNGANAEAMVAEVLEQFGAELARPLVAMLTEVAEASANVLALTAAGLQRDDAGDAKEFTGMLTDMPRLDIGQLDLRIGPSKLASVLGRAWARRRVERKLQSQIGGQVSAAFSSYGKHLEAWFRRTLTDVQARFDSYADADRAQLERLSSQKQVTAEEAAAIRRDLAEIAY